METTEESFSSALSRLKSRYLLTYVGNQPFAFPSQWVAEVILVERSQLLSLPFYSPWVLGAFYHRGQIVPTIRAHFMLSEKLNQELQLPILKETLSVVCLGQAAEHLSGVGIAVDRVDGNISERQISEFETSRWLFQLQDIPDEIWQPQQ